MSSESADLEPLQQPKKLTKPSNEARPLPRPRPRHDLRRRVLNDDTISRHDSHMDSSHETLSNVPVLQSNDTPDLHVEANNLDEDGSSHREHSGRHGSPEGKPPHIRSSSGKDLGEGRPSSKGRMGVRGQAAVRDEGINRSPNNNQMIAKGQAASTHVLSTTGAYEKVCLPRSSSEQAPLARSSEETRRGYVSEPPPGKKNYGPAPYRSSAFPSPNNSQTKTTRCDHVVSESNDEDNEFLTCHENVATLPLDPASSNNKTQKDQLSRKDSLNTSEMVRQGALKKTGSDEVYCSDPPVRKETSFSSDLPVSKSDTKTNAINSLRKAREHPHKERPPSTDKRRNIKKENSDIGAAEWYEVSPRYNILKKRSILKDSKSEQQGEGLYKKYYSVSKSEIEEYLHRGKSGNCLKYSRESTPRRNEGERCYLGDTILYGTESYGTAKNYSKYQSLKNYKRELSPRSKSSFKEDIEINTSRNGRSPSSYKQMSPPRHYYWDEASTRENSDTEASVSPFSWNGALKALSRYTHKSPKLATQPHQRVRPKYRRRSARARSHRSYPKGVRASWSFDSDYSPKKPNQMLAYKSKKMSQKEREEMAKTMGSSVDGYNTSITDISMGINNVKRDGYHSSVKDDGLKETLQRAMSIARQSLSAATKVSQALNLVMSSSSMSMDSYMYPSSVEMESPWFHQTPGMGDTLPYEHEYSPYAHTQPGYGGQSLSHALPRSKSLTPCRRQASQGTMPRSQSSTGYPLEADGGNPLVSNFIGNPRAQLSTQASAEQFFSTHTHKPHEPKKTSAENIQPCKSLKSNIDKTNIAKKVLDETLPRDKSFVHHKSDYPFPPKQQTYCVNYFTMESLSNAIFHPRKACKMSDSSSSDIYVSCETLVEEKAPRKIRSSCVDGLEYQGGLYKGWRGSKYTGQEVPTHEDGSRSKRFKSTSSSPERPLKKQSGLMSSGMSLSQRLSSAFRYEPLSPEIIQSKSTHKALLLQAVQSVSPNKKNSYDQNKFKYFSDAGQTIRSILPSRLVGPTGYHSDGSAVDPPGDILSDANGNKSPCKNLLGILAEESRSQDDTLKEINDFSHTEDKSTKSYRHKSPRNQSKSPKKHNRIDTNVMFDEESVRNIIDSKKYDEDQNIYRKKKSEAETKTSPKSTKHRENGSPRNIHKSSDKLRNKKIKKSYHGHIHEKNTEDIRCATEGEKKASVRHRNTSIDKKTTQPRSGVAKTKRMSPTHRGKSKENHVIFEICGASNSRYVIEPQQNATSNNKVTLNSMVDITDNEITVPRCTITRNEHANVTKCNATSEHTPEPQCSDANNNSSHGAQGGYMEESQENSDWGWDQFDRDHLEGCQNNFWKSSPDKNHNRLGVQRRASSPHFGLVPPRQPTLHLHHSTGDIAYKQDRHRRHMKKSLSVAMKLAEDSMSAASKVAQLLNQCVDVYQYRHPDDCEGLEKLKVPHIAIAPPRHHSPSRRQSMPSRVTVDFADGVQVKGKQLNRTESDNTYLKHVQHGDLPEPIYKKRENCRPNPSIQQTQDDPRRTSYVRRDEIPCEADQRHSEEKRQTSNKEAQTIIVDRHLQQYSPTAESRNDLRRRNSAHLEAQNGGLKHNFHGAQDKHQLVYTRGNTRGGDLSKEPDKEVTSVKRGDHEASGKGGLTKHMQDADFTQEEDLIELDRPLRPRSGKHKDTVSERDLIDFDNSDSQEEYSRKADQSREKDQRKLKNRRSHHENDGEKRHTSRGSDIQSSPDIAKGERKRRGSRSSHRQIRKEREDRRSSHGYRERKSNSQRRRSRKHSEDQEVHTEQLSHRKKRQDEGERMVRKSSKELRKERYPRYYYENRGDSPNKRNKSPQKHDGGSKISTPILGNLNLTSFFCRSPEKETLNYLEHLDDAKPLVPERAYPQPNAVENQTKDHALQPSQSSCVDGIQYLQRQDQRKTEAPKRHNCHPGISVEGKNYSYNRSLDTAADSVDAPVPIKHKYPAPLNTYRSQPNYKSQPDVLGKSKGRTSLCFPLPTATNNGLPGVKHDAWGEINAVYKCNTLCCENKDQVTQNDVPVSEKPTHSNPHGHANRMSERQFQMTTRSSGDQGKYCGIDFVTNNDHQCHVSSSAVSCENLQETPSRLLPKSSNPIRDTEISQDSKNGRMYSSNFTYKSKYLNENMDKNKALAVDTSSLPSAKPISQVPQARPRSSITTNYNNVKREEFANVNSQIKPNTISEEEHRKCAGKEDCIEEESPGCFSRSSASEDPDTSSISESSCTGSSRASSPSKRQAPERPLASSSSDTSWHEREGEYMHDRRKVEHVENRNGSPKTRVPEAGITRQTFGNTQVVSIYSTEESSVNLGSPGVSLQGSANSPGVKSSTCSTVDTSSPTRHIRHPEYPNKAPREPQSHQRQSYPQQHLDVRSPRSASSSPTRHIRHPEYPNPATREPQSHQRQSYPQQHLAVRSPRSASSGIMYGSTTEGVSEDDEEVIPGGRTRSQHSIAGAGESCMDMVRGLQNYILPGMSGRDGKVQQDRGDSYASTQLTYKGGDGVIKYGAGAIQPRPDIVSGRGAYPLYRPLEHIRHATFSPIPEESMTSGLGVADRSPFSNLYCKSHCTDGGMEASHTSTRAVSATCVARYVNNSNNHSSNNSNTNSNGYSSGCSHGAQSETICDLNNNSSNKQGTLPKSYSELDLSDFPEELIDHFREQLPKTARARPVEVVPFSTYHRNRLPPIKKIPIPKLTRPWGRTEAEQYAIHLHNQTFCKKVIGQSNKGCTFDIGQNKRSNDGLKNAGRAEARYRDQMRIGADNYELFKHITRRNSEYSRDYLLDEYDKKLPKLLSFCKYPEALIKNRNLKYL